ncbi:primosomal replication protein PriC [Xenorhabdus szentirmaii]|uniref:Primosomal replication protein N n=2 Tax=Xenorhabdus szentirmaii TaxID=290112 RepID=W1J031_9GAMM|nr:MULTISPECIES: primosomal replication protein [Xenorhabdus]MBD2779479.1 primosomal replication protein [Xenorhabdus sp. 38]MBD2790995.1 primosomal replication protein [Xenorhabdus sp. CUL]MBD2799166.1 primosomal replication protein [Xenorhabdus sp. M]MBD2804031.1 primosomal replication protein [Xenorhabdus sp. ZM]MBD2820181.1 primosomal replication protein [Xenorhabdus sp. 42]
MGIQNLLGALEKQINMLEKELASLSDIPFSAARFDQSLFHHHSNKLGGYLLEIKQNMKQLKSCVADNRAEPVKFLAERLVIQIEGLKREIATQTLRKQEDKFERHSQERDLYQRLAEHQDYERRLIAMVDDRELQLNKQITQADKYKLQKEIAALAGRLTRCRQALMRIEKSIEKQEHSD